MFKHEDFEFGYEIAVGAVYHGHADTGEVLATAGRIKDGDADTWVEQWCATAEAREAEGTAAEAAGRRASAHASYLRACTYFASALYLITHSKTPDRRHEIWLRHRATWDKAVDLAAVPGERVNHPLRGHDAAGLLLPSAGRPTGREATDWWSSTTAATGRVPRWDCSRGPRRRGAATTA